MAMSHLIGSASGAGDIHWLVVQALPFGRLEKRPWAPAGGMALGPPPLSVRRWRTYVGGIQMVYKWYIRGIGGIQVVYELYTGGVYVVYWWRIGGMQVCIGSISVVYSIGGI